ncbi:carboxymethylenebutenolidase-like protein [Patagioenas fasciata monilis]|uniref:Carboxymethylenebutenolidase homolog n=1 Tax=Patagioenas fasciata monilis TaxID=372326 RepID=A0A1V4JWC0_PATFA|nr:carboxymethylenebutenolidase-like protein [Patagioenas fasciata monilis]
MASLAQVFPSTEKSSWYLSEQKQQAGLKQDPALQVSKCRILLYMILGKDLHMGVLDMKTICPDFFKGTEPWKSTDHWADFADWMKEHDPMKVDKETDVTLKYLKEQCGAKKIGIAGFSWGGMAAHHLMLKNSQLAAGVSLYGIIRDSEERYDLLNPTFFIFGEKDHTISYDQITLLEDKLKQYCRVAYKIKVYPGQVHGFAQLKPEDMKPEDKPYIEEARKDMIDWIKQFI